MNKHQIPLIGFRFWRVLSGEYSRNKTSKLLSPLYNGTDFWPYNTPHIAKHNRIPGNYFGVSRTGLEKHEASPDIKCSCGIYGLFYPGTSSERFLSNLVMSPGNVGGFIAAWGKIIKGKHGFRAQYAIPLAFLTMDPRTNLPVRGVDFKELKDLYRVAIADTLQGGFEQSIEILRSRLLGRRVL